MITIIYFFKCWGDFDKCGDIDGGDFAVGRFDQVPLYSIGIATWSMP
jgi:hypothetical protein